MPASNAATLTIALAGNPNSGKTTIFNALTGLRQKVANYPGVTVEKKVGRCVLPTGETAEVIDLPGTYSLISRSPDEQVAMEVLRGLREDTPPPDVVVCVVDASNLQRNLYLVSQLIELGRPLVIALNMIDLAERRGMRVSASRLAAQLGVPVVPVIGHQRKGINHLKAAIKVATVAPMPDWPLPDAMKEEVITVGGGLAILAGDDAPRRRSDERMTQHRLDRFHAVAERLLIGDRAADVEPLTHCEPVRTLLTHAEQRLRMLGIDPMQADIEAHYKWIDEVTSRSLVPACEALLEGGTGLHPVSSRSEDGLKTEDGSKAHATVVPAYAGRTSFTDRLDRILLHRVLGLAVFAAVMAGLFVSIFWLADPIMGATEAGIALAGRYAAGLLPDGPIKDLWTDGIVAGVGAVLVFVPQIALLFLFLAILEDSGYLVRAAFLMDRVLAKVGLHGKSFIPLLSSFACAIPGIMATRTIESPRERLVTIFVAPFMSCAARLPVYALLIGTFFATFSAPVRGGILLSLYLLGILAAVVTALIFKLGASREPASSFILELPTYKRPQLGQVARVVWMNTWAFVSKAGTIIFCLSVILWAMMYYPRSNRTFRPESELVVATVQVKYQDWFRPIGPWDGTTPRPPRSIQAAMDALEQEAVPALPASPIPKEEFRQAEVDRFREALQSSVSPSDYQQIIKLADNLAKQRAASTQLEFSIAGRLGHLIEPAIQPLGFDWKMGVGLIGAFAAREVFVSTMGIVYSVGDVEDDTHSLSEAMLADRYADGKPVWTPLVAVSLLVWFVLAMQCMSTLAIVRRETGSWKWPAVQFLYMNALAYAVSLTVYQVGKVWF